MASHRSRRISDRLQPLLAGTLVLLLAVSLPLSSLSKAVAKPDEEQDEAAEEMPEEEAPGEKPEKKAPARLKAKKAASAKAKATPRGKAGKPLKYGFREGEKYVYEIEIEIDFGDSTRTLAGRSTYGVKRADEDEIVLEHEGSLVGRDQIRNRPTFFDPRHRGAFASFPGGYAGGGQVTIDTSGKVLKNTSEVQLPFLLGPLALLVIEPLSPEGEATWSTSSDLAVGTRPKSNRFGPRSPLRRQAESPAFISAANESAQYTRGSVKGNLVKIKKHLDLKSTQAPSETGIPTLETSGDGEITFDSKAGMPKKARIDQKLHVTIGQIEGKIPLTVSYRLLGAEEVAKLDKEAAEQQAKQAAEEAERNRPLNDGDVRAALAELKVPDKRRAAAERLAKGPANDQQQQVAKVLTAMLKDPDDGVVGSAAKALAVWGSPESVPQLVKILNNSDNVFVKSDVMKALAALKDERGAEAIAKQLPHDRHNASRALQAIGSPAETYVIPLLDDRDGWVRSEAAKILGVIGTQKSVAALEKLAQSGRGFEARDAQKAIKQIAARE